jgi:chromosome segregation ATPase
MGAPTNVSKTHNSRGWSYYIILASSTIGSITTIAMAILGHFVIGIITGLLSLTGFFAAYQISNLRVMKNLEGYVAELSQKTEVLAGLLSALQKSEGDLAGANSEFNRISALYKETAQKQKMELERRLTSLSAVVQQTKSNQGSFQAITLKNKTLIEVLKSEDKEKQALLGELTAKNKSLERSIQELQASQQELGKEVASTRLIQDELAEAAEELDKNLTVGEGLVASAPRFELGSDTVGAISTAASALGHTKSHLRKDAEALAATAVLFEATVNRLASRGTQDPVRGSVHA